MRDATGVAAGIATRDATGVATGDGIGPAEWSAGRREQERDLDDAAAVLAILTVLAGLASDGSGDGADGAPSLWSDAARRLGVEFPGRRSWWASGLPR